VRKGLSDRLGKCYQLAGRYVVDHHDVTLVHGTINGRKWGLADFDNPHAWVVEADGVVYDLVWDDRFDADAFAAIFDAKEIVRYSRVEVRNLILQTEHWGPWNNNVKGQENDTGRTALCRRSK
jgi:hypothetical protein